MSRLLQTSLLLILLSSRVSAQGGPTGHVTSGPTPPLKCSPKSGDVFYKTSVSPAQFCTCTITNVWVCAVNGGGLTGPAGPTGPAGSNGTNGTNGSNGAVGPTGPTGPAGSIYPGCVSDGANGVSCIGGFTADNLNTKSALIPFRSLTSGTVTGFAAPDTAGADIAYMLPTANGVAGQFLKDSGVATCGTYVAGAPAVCHQLIWDTPSGGGGSSKIDYQAATGTITGNSTVYSTSIPSIPTGSCIRVAYNVLSTSRVTSPLYDMCFGATCVTGFIGQPLNSTYTEGEVEICNNPGVQNAQKMNMFCGHTHITSTSLPFCFTGTVASPAENTTGAVTLLFKTISGGGADTVQGIWWHVFGPN